MSNAAGIVPSAGTGGSDDDLPDEDAEAGTRDSTGVHEKTGLPEVMWDSVADTSDGDSPDDSPKDVPAVDDRPPAVLRLERAQRLKREGEIARAEHDAAVIATDQKTARLKALRLEREAADRIVAAKEAAAKAELKPAAKRKRVVKAPA